MDREITLILPETIYRRAERLAELTGHDVLDVLSSTLGRSLPPLTNEFAEVTYEKLSDQEVIALADSMMEPNLSDRLSALQYKQQAGTVTEEERAELQMLMDVFSAGQLRKTRAFVEAVRRGLRPAGKS